MARKGTWIEGLHPHDPVEAAARHALEVRLAVVSDWLPKAALGPLSETENVHQLRVSTRRAVAAMDVFAALLPARRALWIGKQLRRVRRAAGSARDLDVMGLRLGQLADERGDARFRLLQQSLAERRQQAQPAIAAIHEKLQRTGFADKQSTLLARVRLRDKADKLLRPTFGSFARRAIRVLVDDFFAVGESDLTDLAALHAFRIQAKQLRYAMELFASAFGPALRGQLYGQVEKLQDMLGEANDYATAQRHVQEWLGNLADPRAAAAVHELTLHDHQAMEEGLRAFREWWTVKRCERLRQDFAQCLAVEPARPAR